MGDDQPARHEPGREQRHHRWWPPCRRVQPAKWLHENAREQIIKSIMGNEEREEREDRQGQACYKRSD